MSKHREAFIIFFLMAITFGLYFQVYQFEFIGFDDNEYVYDNPNVTKGISLESLQWAFTAFHSNNWHPLTWISHMLDCRIFGLNSGWHHLVNMLFHLANSILLFLVFKKMTGDFWQSAFLSIIFAVHPLHVESVAWISERKDVLSTFFFVLTLLAYVSYARKPAILRYLLITVLFILGLLSKPMVVTLPCILILLDYWPLDRFKKAATPFHLVAEKLPLFVFAVISCVLTYLAQNQGGVVKSFDTFSLSHRIANAIVSYANYMWKTIYPADMAFLYPHPQELVWWKVAGAFLILAVISLLAVRHIKDRPYLFVGWLWFLGTLVPVIGLVQVGMQSMADRYMYIPMIGLLMMISWGLSEISAKWRFAKTVFAISALTAILLLTVVSFKQIAYWKDTLKMLKHTVQATENNYIAHHILGANLFVQGNTEDAINNYLRAVKISPDYHDSHFNLGLAYTRLGEIDNAIYHYYKAVALRPDYAQTYSNLGAAFFRKKDYKNALKNYLQANKIIPDRVDVHFNLGIIYFKLGKFDKAIEHYQQAIKIQPDFADAYFHLGCAVYSKGDVAGAVACFKRTLLIRPDHVLAANYLAKISN